MGNGRKYDTKVTGYDPKAAKSQQKFDDFKYFKICYCKNVPHSLSRRQQKLLNLLILKYPLKLKGYTDTSFSVIRKYYLGAKWKFSELYSSMTSYHISSALLPYSSEVSFSKRKMLSTTSSLFRTTTNWELFWDTAVRNL